MKKEKKVVCEKCGGKVRRGWAYCTEHLITFWKEKAEERYYAITELTTENKNLNKDIKIVREENRRISEDNQYLLGKHDGILLLSKVPFHEVQDGIDRTARARHPITKSDFPWNRVEE